MNYSNNAHGYIITPLSSTGTTFQISNLPGTTTARGDVFPAGDFVATITEYEYVSAYVADPSTGVAMPPMRRINTNKVLRREIVHISTRTGNTFTISARAFESCPVTDETNVYAGAAQSFSTGSRVDLFLTAGELNKVVGMAPVIPLTTNKVLYSKAGAIAEEADFTYDATTNTLGITGSATVNIGSAHIKTMINGIGDIGIGHNSTSQDIYVDTLGKVGIHTVSPQADFHSVGTARLDIGSDATADIYYRGANGNLTRLPIGAAGQNIEVSPAGIPIWKTKRVLIATAIGNDSAVGWAYYSGSGINTVYTKTIVLGYVPTAPSASNISYIDMRANTKVRVASGGSVMYRDIISIGNVEISGGIIGSQYGIHDGLFAPIGDANIDHTDAGIWGWVTGLTGSTVTINLYQNYARGNMGFSPLGVVQINNGPIGDKTVFQVQLYS